MIARIATTVAGLVLIIYGVIAAISPLPLGVPLVILGLFMIAGANPAFRPVIRYVRRNWRWFDKLVRMIAPRARGAVRTVIAETDPARQDRTMDEKTTGDAATGEGNEENNR